MPEKRIGDRTFRTENLPATEAARTLIRLTKLAGPGLGKLTGALADEEARAGMAVSAIADVLMANDPDTLTAFLVEVAERAEVRTENGTFDPVVFDIHCADLMDAIQLVAFVLQVNFRDFFGDRLGSVLAAPNSKAA